jgi:sugar-specific transcriptional regulator TrmB
MDEGEAVDALERLGLTTYEAKVFIALQKLGAGTARETSRVADVPRSQVYSVAESLEDRGLVAVQQSNPMRYRAVSIEAARKTLRERFETETDRAFEYVETVRNERGGDGEQQEAIWTLSGRDHVADRAAEIVRDAEDHVVFPARSTDLIPDDLAAALLEAADAGVDVHVVSLNADVRALFDGEPNVTISEPPYPRADDEHTGRAVFADGDVVLMSVLGNTDGLPELTTETAFWTAHTNFATVLYQLGVNTITAPGTVGSA